MESDLLTSADFLKTCLSTVVVGFFRSSNLQPRQCPFFTLGVWPKRAKGVSFWNGACGSRLVFQGAVGGFSMVPRFTGEFLLQRSPVAARGLHAPLLATMPPNAGLDVCFCFRVLIFFFLVCSQFAFVMLKYYWTICWLRC
jgi:hypothetical protein